MDNVGRKKLCKWENPEENSKNLDITHHSFPIGDIETLKSGLQYGQRSGSIRSYPGTALTTRKLSGL